MNYDRKEELDVPLDIVKRKFQKARMFENNNENAENYRLFHKNRKQVFQKLHQPRFAKKEEPLSQLEKDRKLNELLKELKTKKEKETK